MGIMDRNSGNRDFGSNKNKNKWMLLLIFFAAAAVLCGAILGVRAYRQKEAQRRMQELAEQARAGQNTEKGGELDLQAGGDAPGGQQTAETTGEAAAYAWLEELGIPLPDKEVDFGTLAEETNPDIYAWIYIPDSLIDYPVLQHPTDDSYYLKHNLDGSRGYPGCIYTERYNARDFSDPNTVVYGHNMKNGSMFAGLHKYEDAEYFEEHPYVYIYTPEKLYVYEIFAAYEFNNLHLLLNYDFTDEDVYGKYLEDIMEVRSMSSNIREGVDVAADKHILTLSTCIADKPNNRYLVQGVLLNEDK